MRYFQSMAAHSYPPAYPCCQPMPSGLEQWHTCYGNALNRVTTARWTKYIVFYTHCKRRRFWHVCRYSQIGLYWSTHPCPWLNISAEIVHSPSFKERKMSKFEMTRQSLQCSSLWNFFQPLQFAIKSAPSMSSLFNLLLSFEKESTLLLIASVINKLSTLSAPSMIDFFFTNFNLSNTTKHILLDSLLQEARVTEI